MRKFIAGLIAGVIVATASATFGADAIRLVVNGKEITFPDAPPQIINGRTMVPARPLAEALGATVKWDAETRTVIVDPSNMAKTATLDITLVANGTHIPSTAVYDDVGGIAVSIRTLPKFATFVKEGDALTINGFPVAGTFIANSSTYVPLSSVAQALSGTFKWDSVSLTATLNF